MAGVACAISARLTIRKARSIPFVAQLEASAGFESDSDAGARLDRLEALLGPTSRNAPRDVALLAELLGVPADGRFFRALAASPQQKREMISRRCSTNSKGMAAKGPVLIVFEDVHWIDPTSQELLDRMVAPRLPNWRC